MIDKEDSLPVTRQCEILELSRSGIYYTPVPISARDMELMRQIDEIHLLYPFYGSRNIRNELWGKGYDIGRDRVRRLMRRMGIEALYAGGDEPCSFEVIKERILQSVGPDTDIYEEAEGRAIYAPNALLVNDVIDKMFELRDRFVHGAWAPKSWLDKPMRSKISGGSLTLPDVLREAASFILRTGIKKKLRL